MPASGDPARVSATRRNRATSAYVADFFILPAHRGRAVARQLMARIKSHPGLQGLRRWSLGTRDAHGLYRQFGFREPADPSLWMEIYTPDVYAPHPGLMPPRSPRG
jgi:GNAT superfamily N-acetyltransferase